MTNISENKTLLTVGHQAKSNIGLAIQTKTSLSSLTTSFSSISVDVITDSEGYPLLDELDLPVLEN